MHVIEYYYYHYGLLLLSPEALYICITVYLSLLNLSVVTSKFPQLKHIVITAFADSIWLTSLGISSLPTFQTGHSQIIIIIIIIIIRSQSYDRTAASSIACSSQTAICCFLFQFPVSFCFLNFIQYLLKNFSSLFRHLFLLSFLQ